MNNHAARQITALSVCTFDVNVGKHDTDIYYMVRYNPGYTHCHEVMCHYVNSSIPVL